jgi:Sec-independent protein translocase protein TatA
MSRQVDRDAARHAKTGRAPWLLFVLLTAGVVLAGGRPEAGQAAGAAEAQAQTVAAQAQTEPAPEQGQAQTDEPQAETEAAPGQTEQEDATLISTPGGKALGMSILGNQEAPTSLVIVPWKSSELGGSVGVSTLLDDSKGPVDKDVFMRALRYYEIRSASKP